MKRWHIITFGVVAIVGLLFLNREPAMMRLLDARTPKSSLVAHQEFIAEGIEVHLPSVGEAPFPVVLQFHGCAGIRQPFQNQWADVANQAGYAAMIVDSMGPRRLTRQGALETVCAGKKLLGQERAGDVLAAVKLAEADPRLDADHLVIAAWSHGAWSIMDYLTMDMKFQWPAGIRREAAETSPVDGAILFYPYCGAGTLSRFRVWTQSPPVLAIIAGADTIVDANLCINYFEQRRRKNEPVDLVVYPEAQHAFDDPFLEPEWIHWYNEEYLIDAKARYEEFLINLPDAPAP